MEAAKLWALISGGVWDTLYMTIPSTLFAYLLGLPLGILLVSLGYALESVFKASRWKNITYEFFLLHFPVLQVIIEMFPTMPIGQLGIIAFPVSIVLAYSLNAFVLRLPNRR